MTTGTHTEHEDDPWIINIGDHPGRTDSPLYLRSRKAMVTVVQLVQPWFFGDKPYQDHHGGGLWVRDEQGWFLVKNLAGIEWSSQFAGDPAKFELLRLNAERLIAGFPLTEKAYADELGMTADDIAILHTKITDTAGIAAWTDSFWNASVPLPGGFHTGTITSGDHEHGGVHYYPTPITDIQFIKQDDFTLWVIDPSTGKQVAVSPVAPRGSGDGRVRLLYHPDKDVEQMSDDERTLAPDHPVALAAFRAQRSTT